MTVDMAYRQYIDHVVVCRACTSVACARGRALRIAWRQARTLHLRRGAVR